MKTKKPLKRKTPMRRVSKKRQRDSLVYAQKRKWFLAHPDNTACPVAAAGWVSGGHLAPTEIHHVWRRGKYFLDESTWLAVSAKGHRWIEDNKEVARSLGWLCDTKETQAWWRWNHDGLPVA